VAFLVDSDLATAVAAALPDNGHVKHLRIAGHGVHLVTQLG
jgi:hypothetical protein